MRSLHAAARHGRSARRGRATTVASALTALWFACGAAGCGPMSSGDAGDAVAIDATSNDADADARAPDTSDARDDRFDASDAPSDTSIDASMEVADAPPDNPPPPDVPRDIPVPIDSGLDRHAGDQCPGITVATDGTVTVVDTSGFTGNPDVGTSCGSGAATTGFVDAIFTFTLASARNVVVNVTATGVGTVSAEVSSACGMRSTALAGCTTGVPSRRLYRNLAAGTYFVVVDFATPSGAPTRTITITVDSSAPTMALPGDACPGQPLALDGPAVTFDTTMLAPDFSLSCLASARADAALSFVAPAAGSDVLANVSSSVTGSAAALQVQRACGSMPVDPCASRTGSPAITPWARYRGLTAGASYTLVASTNATTGMLSARAYTIPAATPMAVSGNDTCAGARAIPETGGIFTGTTVGATLTSAYPAGCAPGCTTGAPDVVYRLDLTSRRRVIASMLGSTYDTLMFIQTGATCPGSPVAGACNDDAYALASALDVTLDPGTYWIVVSGCGATVAGAYSLDVATIPP